MGRYIYTKRTPVDHRTERRFQRMENVVFALQEKRDRTGVPLTDKEFAWWTSYGASLRLQGRMKYLTAAEARQHDQRCIQKLLLSIFDGSTPMK